MTPEKLELAVERLSGQMLAFMRALRAMQSQPGYDHAVFLASLSQMDVGEEMMPGRDRSTLLEWQLSAFELTLSYFRAPPLPEPPNARVPPP